MWSNTGLWLVRTLKYWPLICGGGVSPHMGLCCFIIYQASSSSCYKHGTFKLEYGMRIELLFDAGLYKTTQQYVFTKGRTWICVRLCKSITGYIEIEFQFWNFHMFFLVNVAPWKLFLQEIVLMMVCDGGGKQPSGPVPKVRSSSCK